MQSHQGKCKWPSDAMLSHHDNAEASRQTCRVIRVFNTEAFQQTCGVIRVFSSIGAALLLASGFSFSCLLAGSWLGSCAPRSGCRSPPALLCWRLCRRLGLGSFVRSLWGPLHRWLFPRLLRGLLRRLLNRLHTGVPIRCYSNEPSFWSANDGKVGSCTMVVHGQHSLTKRRESGQDSRPKTLQGPCSELLLS